jgi:predicted AlkP superfamily phosphohydrolase/phosphomutase
VKLLATIALGGGLWGATLGLWLVVPALVRAHSLVPRTLQHWLVLDAALLAISAAMGVVLSLILAFPLLAWQAARRRPGRDAAWTIVLSLGALLPLGYLVAAMLVEWTFFGRVPAFRRHPAYLVAALGAYGAFAASLWILHGRTDAAGHRSPVRRLLAGLVVAALAGAVALPFRIPSPSTAPVDGGALVRRAGRPAGSPLLLVGLDSANWDTLQPPLDRGALPTFGGLVSGGMHGDVRALWRPYWSVPAWAAILTGHPIEETGVHGDLAIEAPGLPAFYAPLVLDVLLDPFFLVEWQLIGLNFMRAVHPPREMLQRPPVWELLGDAGVETAVVRFDFSYPAPKQGVVVSNHVGRDNWRLLRARPSVGDRLVQPAAMAEELLAAFSDEKPFDHALLAEILPSSVALGDAFDHDVLRTALDIDDRTIDASLRILRERPDVPFLGVYLSGLDEVCHAFWEYRFPEAYGDAAPAPEDVARWGGVIDRYLEFLDRRLARLIGAYGTRPNVIIVSDHGHEPVFDHPVWRGWHGPTGAFIAGGPDFPRRDRRLEVSYFDVMPTVVDALGFDVPAGAHGVSLRR